MTSHRYYNYINLEDYYIDRIQPTYKRPIFASDRDCFNAYISSDFAARETAFWTIFHCRNDLCQ